LELRGRNGEGISQERLTVYLNRNTDGEVKTINVDTDSTGKILLGNLESISSMKAVGKFGQQLWQIESMSTSSLHLRKEGLRICEGETMVLPSLCQDLDAESKMTHQLIRVNKAGEFLSDNTKNMKIEGKMITINGLKVGSYNLCYIKKQVVLNLSLVVLDAKRWKHS
jgi:hypothetical protein